MRTVALTTILVLLLAGCGRSVDNAGDASIDPPEHEPPVVINPNPPVEYPVDLFNRGIEGTVVLRLYVTEAGVLVDDSTRIAESSGHAELDSAALVGVANMRFAPAQRRGEAVATAFLQPVHFRQPGTASLSGEPR